MHIRTAGVLFVITAFGAAAGAVSLAASGAEELHHDSRDDPHVPSFMC